MKYDIAIIGAGPGGYTAAIRAAQLGAKVALIEKDKVGGVCLNRGCIPSKAIIASVDRYNQAKGLSKFGIKIENLSYDYSEIFARKNKIVRKLERSLTQLIESNGINLIKGEACIESGNSLKVLSDSGEKTVEFNNLILATGSRPVSLPNITIDHKFVLDTDDVLNLEQLPESVLIVGSGAVGIEWTRVFNGFGKKVIITEIAPELAPMLDKSIAGVLERNFRKKKIEYYTGTAVEKIEGGKVSLSNGMELAPDIVFLAAGRSPNVEIKGIENLNLEFNKKFFKVDNNLKTSVGNIYAIGDVTGLYPVAHAASHQGIKAVEHILLNKEANIDYKNVPLVIYGYPEIASAGYREDELAENGVSFQKSIFPMSALGKSAVEEELDGFVKIIADDDKILGIHIISDRGAELLQQLTIAKSAGISPEKLKDVIFAHPTYSEAVHEALLGISKESFHLPPGFKLRI